MIVGLHPMLDFQNLFLNGVQFAGKQSHWWQNWLSLILCHADENVAAAQIVEIIGESTHRMENGLRVPALLKFQTLPLHGLSVQNVLNVNGQVHRATRID